MDEESRDWLRIDLGKLAFAKMGDIAHGGLLKNISASGLAIEFVYPTGKVENPFKHGDYIEIEIDEIGSLKGTITRSYDKGIAIKLHIDTEDEEELIARIMAAYNDISLDEE